MDVASLIDEARQAAAASHSPYSHFRVGAAVVAGGEVFRGTNVENASYGLTICAERAAIFAAVSAGHRRLEAVAVTCIDAPGDASIGMLMPCGACRQVMAEFGAADMPVHVDRLRAFRMDELLPLGFSLK